MMVLLMQESSAAPPRTRHSGQAEQAGAESSSQQQAEQGRQRRGRRADGQRGKAGRGRAGRQAGPAAGRCVFSQRSDAPRAVCAVPPSGSGWEGGGLGGEVFQKREPARGQGSEKVVKGPRVVSHR